MKLTDLSADDIAEAVGATFTLKTLDKDIARTETKGAACSHSHMHYKPKYSQVIALSIYILSIK